MKVIFDEKVIEFLAKLPKETRIRIFDKIMSSYNNPLRFFERLEGRTDYKLRVGDYRVIADIKDKIEITKIGRRKNIYKN